MKYLLDTHVLLWIAGDPQKLSDKARNIYGEEANDIYLSAASLWEMAIKSSLGKLKLGVSLKTFLQERILPNGIQILPISTSHILEVESLPFHHRDPFDRLLIGQSLSENMPIMTSDPNFSKYPVAVVF